MKFYRTLLMQLLSAAIITSSMLAQATISTGSIMASSASTSCLDYKVVGTCFWLFCTQFGCKVRTSTKVKHFLPEMVVSSYNHGGQNPWSEVSSFNQGAVKGGEYQTVSGGHGTSGGRYYRK